MNLVIKPVRIDEVELLAEVSRRTFYDTFYQQNTKEDMELFLEHSFNVATLQQEISETENFFFFAKAGDEIVGYLKLSTRETPEELEGVDIIEIARIYAVKEKIGLGVGKFLIESAISFGKELKKQVIWLGVWEHNLKAINFYQRFGFEKFGEHLFLVGNDAQNDWLMKRELFY